jgi:hypothetical protein
MTIPQERAERIARAHACAHCLEYTWRKVSVRAAAPALQEEFGEVWHAVMLCGVCGSAQELGIDGEGEVVYQL